MVLVLLALLIAGCSPSEQQLAERTAANVGYDAELVRCKEQGKASGSFAVFEACERASSRRLCQDHPELREKWSRCKEVWP